MDAPVNSIYIQVMYQEITQINYIKHNCLTQQNMTRLFTNMWQQKILIAQFCFTEKKFVSNQQIFSLFYNF